MIEGRSDVKLAQTTILRRASTLAVQRVCRWLLAAWLAHPGVSRRLSRRLSRYSRLLPAVIDSSEGPEALYQIHSLSAIA